MDKLNNLNKSQNHMSTNSSQNENNNNNTVNFKRIEEDALIKASTAAKPQKKDKYYIASGFFNPEQVKDVDKIEAAMDGLNISYFSPRQESCAFFKETDPEIKAAMTKLIFNNNLDSMDACNKYIVNLRGNDQGTLFEYGYIYAGYCQGSITSIKQVLTDIKVINDETGLVNLVLDNTKIYNSSLKLDLEVLFKHALDQDFTEKVIQKYFGNNKVTFYPICIDDRHAVNCFLIGFLYRMGAPVITYSRKGFGSNVMLVHSAYHCENEQELETLVQALSLGDMSINELYRNKQTWNKQID